MLRIIKRAVKKILGIPRHSHGSEEYDFNKSNPLGGNGERVDIQLQGQTDIDFEKLDMYQKSHFKRYQFAKTIVQPGEVCGDFACGTGYGSVMIAEKAKHVTGADLDTVVVNAIKERYKEKQNVTFLNENLLHLTFANHFDTIVSFETIEHFTEENIKKLLKIYNVALKENGKLIFSTPYMQERSEDAVKLGFHLTFYIDEQKINSWLNEAGFKATIFKYQNYSTHHIHDKLDKKDFIICVATKIKNA